MNIIMQDGISGFVRNDIGGFGGPTFPSGELTPPIVEQPVENAQEITQQGMEVNTETKPPFFTEEGQVADVKSAEELAYKEKEFREEEATREAELKKEYETGLTAEQRENLEVFNKLKEKFPHAFVLDTEHYYSSDEVYISNLDTVAPEFTDHWIKESVEYAKNYDRNSSRLVLDLRKKYKRRATNDEIDAIFEALIPANRPSEKIPIVFTKDGLILPRYKFNEFKPRPWKSFERGVQDVLILTLNELNRVGKEYKEYMESQQDNESIDDMLSRLGF